MTDKTKTDSNTDDQRQAAVRPIRRPWHAPRFHVTDIASTDTVGQGGTDGGGMGSAS
ncbi:MAG: hypothetical protein QOD40_2099 [Alphaproteobacteria bacterium]|jgi:hypothetical protein|nr:hypothetical protein [Alphaproteobacteria bacterium]